MSKEHHEARSPQLIRSIDSFDSLVLAKVRDVVLFPPEASMCRKLKKRIKERIDDYDATLLRSLLTGLSLKGKKPITFISCYAEFHWHWFAESCS